jgi:hypothetical protein
VSGGIVEARDSCWRAEEKALSTVAPQLDEALELTGPLDALGGDRQAERVSELDHGRDDRGAVFGPVNGTYQGSVYLHLTDRQPP